MNAKNGNAIFRSTVNRIGCEDVMVIILDCRASQEQHVKSSTVTRLVLRLGLTRLILRYEYVAMADDENKCQRKVPGALLSGVQFKYIHCEGTHSSHCYGVSPERVIEVYCN
jgi:hypothetical protein